MRKALLLCLLLHSILITSCEARKKGTRYEDKPPGWRPDRPKEAGIEIVERMLRTLGPSIVSGRFFHRYQQMNKDMNAANDELRPVSLMAEGMSAKVDPKMEASLKAVADGFRWQQSQVEMLDAAVRGLADPKAEVSAWPSAAVDWYLLESGVVDDEELPKLSQTQRVSVASDLAKLHRIFAWAFNSMPDDEEAQQITRMVDKEQGYPPPSQPPPAPPAPPQQAKAKGRHGKDASRRKRHKRRRKDEL